MKNTNRKLSSDQIKHIAQLANLEISDGQIPLYTTQLSNVIDYISKIQALDTQNTPETTQVTGLKNVLREDVVDKTRMFTQEEALSNAKKTYKGYFLIKSIF